MIFNTVIEGQLMVMIRSSIDAEPKTTPLIRYPFSTEQAAQPDLKDKPVATWETIRVALHRWWWDRLRHDRKSEDGADET